MSFVVGSPEEPLFVIHTSLLQIYFVKTLFIIAGVYPEARLRDDDTYLSPTRWTPALAFFPSVKFLDEKNLLKNI